MANKADNFETYAREYADAAGLKATDMPSSHHPLLESNDEIRNLSDLIDARQEVPRDDLNAHDLGADDPNLDIEEALTLPHKRHEPTRNELTPAVSDFDADALTHTKPDDDDDEAYMTRDDVEDDMDESDPDPNVGADRSDFIGDSGIDRAPNLSGTVTGIARGMATHLPQDLGADGFQILEPEDLATPLSEDDDESESVDPNADGNVIPTATPNINSRDDALDATRRLR